MQKNISKIIALLLLSSVFSFTTSAQNSSQLKSQFTEFMKAFPANFVPLIDKSSYDTREERYLSTIQIDGTSSLYIYSESGEEKNYVKALIELPGSFSDDQSIELFSDWKTRIAALDFNGVKLEEIDDPKYEEDEFFIKAAAWQLDNSANNIAEAYQGFTIRLELRDYEMGGWELDLIIAHRDVEVY